MDSPLVSVLIPLYNHEKFIVSCLNSILNDDYPHKEIIIINDGSTDQSHHKVINWIKENQTRLTSLRMKYVSQENNGVCKTLNQLIALAKGEMVKLIASDDCLLPGMLKYQVEFLAKNKNKMVVFSDSLVINEVGGIIYKSLLSDFLKRNKKNYRDDENLRQQIITRWGLHSGSAIIRKEIYKYFKYDERLMVEDLDFYLFAVAKNSLIYLDKIVAAYRIHNTNTSAVAKKPDPQRRLRLLTDTEKILIKRENLFLSQDKKFIVSQICLTKAKINWLNKRWTSVLINLLSYGLSLLEAYIILNKKAFKKHLRISALLKLIKTETLS